MKEAITSLKLLASDPLAMLKLNPEHVTLLHKDRLARYELTRTAGEDIEKNKEREREKEKQKENEREREKEKQKDKEKKKVAVNKRKRNDKGQQSSAAFEAKRAAIRAKKARMKIPRCASPCHFNTSDNIQQYGPDYLNELPDRKNVDSMLEAVSSLYYREEKDDKKEKKFFFSTIDLLTNLLRKPSVMDSWAPKEIALFEAGIFTFGKDFYQIQKLIKNKKTADCVQFYYFWKRSAHYRIWKSHHRKPKSAAGGLKT